MNSQPSNKSLRKLLLIVILGLIVIISLTKRTWVLPDPTRLGNKMIDACDYLFGMGTISLVVAGCLIAVVITYCLIMKLVIRAR